MSYVHLEEKQKNLKQQNTHTNKTTNKCPPTTSTHPPSIHHRKYEYAFAHTTQPAFLSYITVCQRKTNKQTNENKKNNPAKKNRSIFEPPCRKSVAFARAVTPPTQSSLIHSRTPPPPQQPNSPTPNHPHLIPNPIPFATPPCPVLSLSLSPHPPSPCLLSPHKQPPPSPSLQPPPSPHTPPLSSLFSTKK